MRQKRPTPVSGARVAKGQFRTHALQKAIAENVIFFHQWLTSAKSNKAALQNYLGPRAKEGVVVVFKEETGGKSLIATPSGRHSNAAVRPSTTSAIHANNCSMEVSRSDPIESAKTNLFDTSTLG
jgi:hypothetical protein